MRISDWSSDVCSSDLDVAEGRYFLPGSATGYRETIITSPLRAEPEYLQIMPGPSVWPLLAAIFTAGFFLLLTVQSYRPGLVSGVIAILCVFCPVLSSGACELRDRHIMRLALASGIQSEIGKASCRERVCQYW